MIDPENEVFTLLKNALLEKFDGINVTNQYVETPPSFPHVNIEMSDRIFTRHVGDPPRPTSARCTFDINVYSCNQEKRKQECKEITNYIADFLASRNFVCIFSGRIANIDRTVYRMLGKYVVDTDGEYFYKRSY